jgi:zinc protease
MKHLAFAVLLLLFPLVSGHSQTLDVKTYELKNGMKILVQEDHSIPNIALYIFYRIGSRNEHPGTTGISHFFEHMMFNGAKKYGPKQLDVVMEAAGGSNNAYTSRDVTVYQDWFPRSAMDLIFDIEGDRIEYLSFDPKMIESERGVVASERRTSVDNNNYGILNEQLWADAFVAHPYQWPVVGWMSDIENWKMEDLKHHFEMGYSPNNATMVVVGDVTGEEIHKLAQKYLEKIPSHDRPAKVTTKEPEQIGERRAVVKKFAQLPLVYMGYHVPETANPDYYALRVLDAILFTGESSRMYQRIVDKEELALSVESNLPTAFDPTLFLIVAQPREQIAPEKLEASVYAELEKASTGAVSDQELTKAKNILVAEFYRSMKTINGKANTLGTYEIFFGDYKKMFTAPEEYSKVTKADLMRVAKKYFQPANRTVVTLIPDASGETPQ